MAAARLSFQPLISVIVPVWNTEARWLEAAIESVRRQIYPQWELCIADDASDLPATIDALRRLEKDPRIKITRLDRNSGISAASNAALAFASGEFVALLDHDDELTPDALFEMVVLLGSHRDADLIYTDEDKLDLQRPARASRSSSRTGRRSFFIPACTRAIWRCAQGRRRSCRRISRRLRGRPGLRPDAAGCATDDAHRTTSRKSSITGENCRDRRPLSSMPSRGRSKRRKRRSKTMSPHAVWMRWS